MKLEITEQDKKNLNDAVELAITSARRAQKNAKQLDLESVWRKIEIELSELKVKLAGAK